MTPGRAAAFAALVVYGWWATSLPPFSGVAALAVLAGGVVALGWGITHRRPRSRPIERRGLTVWLVLALALAGWQLVAFVQEPRSRHPTISSITNAVLETHVAQALAFAGWLFVAVKLAER
jgi:hypothetical protein